MESKMKRFDIMKKLLLSTLALSIVAGCQKSVVNADVDPNEIQIFASGSSDILAKTNNTTITDFGQGSSIGLFTQLKADADAGNSTTLSSNKNNSRFNYAVPLWIPETKLDKLSYHDTDPIYIMGYYPHTDMQGSSLRQSDPNTTPHLLDFTLATDQSSETNLRMSDLMYCKADNRGLGYTRQGEPIPLLFKHQLCRVSLYIRLIDSKPGSTPITRALLNKISITGPQIFTKSEFNALTGVNTIVNNNVNGSVVWTPGQSAMDMTIVADKSVAPTFVTDLILIPFTAEEKKNVFEYSFEFTEGNKHDQTFRTELPAYSGTTAPPAAADGNKMRFGANDHTQITVTIDVSTAFINLEVSIAPWIDGANTELEGERS